MLRAPAKQLRTSLARGVRLPAAVHARPRAVPLLAAQPARAASSSAAAASLRLAAASPLRSPRPAMSVFQRRTLAQHAPAPVPTASAGAAASLPAALRTRNLLAQTAQLLDGPWASRCLAASDRLLPQQLASEQGRRARLAVIGASSSGAAELVTALLDDPLSTQSHRLSLAAPSSADAELGEVLDPLRALRERHTRRLGMEAGALRLLYGAQPGLTERVDEVTLPLDWLRTANVELVEVLDPSDPRADEAMLDLLYSCDALVFTVSASELSRSATLGPRAAEADPTLSLLSHFASKPGTRLAINHDGVPPAAGTSPAQAWDVMLDSAVGQEAGHALRRHAAEPVQHVNAALAARANDALRRALETQAGAATSGNGDALELWETFRTYSAAARLQPLHSLLISPPVLPAFQQAGEDAREALLLQTAGVVSQHALDEAAAVLYEAREEVRRAEGLATVLRSDADASIASLREAILAAPAEGEGDDSSMISSATKVHLRAGDRSHAALGVLSDSGAELEQTFSRRLPWWKLGWKVDDVRAEVEAGVMRSFAKDLEEKLIFEAGHLLSVAEAQSRKTFDALDTLTEPLSSRSKGKTEAQDARSGSVFASALLRNTVSQHTLAGARAALKPRALAEPISARRAQLFAPGGPVDVLVARAQALVVSTYLSVATVIGASVASAHATSPVLARTPLGQALPDVLSSFALTPSTASGVAALGCLLLAWRLQGRWGRAKRKFWQDWDRLAQGLDADLEAKVEGMLRAHVFAQPLSASDALRKLAAQRASELEARASALRHTAAEARALQPVAALTAEAESGLAASEPQQSRSQPAI